jgi:hypothetical protein
MFALATISAQQATRVTVLGDLNVDLDIAGVSFNIRFSPEIESAAAVAQRLCTEQAQRIGVNQENLKECLAKVGNYLQAAVDDWVSEKTLSAPVVVNGKHINVEFIPEADSPVSIATKACTDHQQFLGVTNLNSCIKSIGDHLQGLVDNWYAEKTMNVGINISGKDFELTFMPERQSPNDMAKKLCHEQADALGVTREFLPTCVDRVTEYLNTAVTQWVQSKTLDFSLSVDNKPYRFRFFPERESSEAVASHFCSSHAEEFQLTRENIEKVCIEPMNSRIAEVVHQWVNSKIVTVPVQVGTQVVDIRFIPERETTRRVATRFCLTNAKSLQLTEQNFSATCVDPVNNILIEGLQKSKAAKTA